MNARKDDFEENEEEKDSILSKKEKKLLPKIGNSWYDIDTLNKITIVRLKQCDMPQKKIRKILNMSKALTSSWANYEKMQPKKWGL